MKLSRPHNFKTAGFSFPEVLFAVMILGIGLIMVASMFPVGIRLSQQSAEVVTVDSIGRAAAKSTITACATKLTDATNKIVHAAPATVFDDVKGNRISESDPRFAWIPLYRWNGVSPTKELYFFIAKSQRDDTYLADPGNVTNTLNRDLVPKQITNVQFTDSLGNTADLIQFPAATGANANRELIGEGAYVLIADYGDPAAIGQVYRVGQIVDAATGTWELLPGADLQQSGLSVKPTGGPATVYVLGKQLRDVTADYDATSNNELVSPIQDVGFYKTTVVP